MELATLASMRRRIRQQRNAFTELMQLEIRRHHRGKLRFTSKLLENVAPRISAPGPAKLLEVRVEQLVESRCVAACL